MKISFFLLKLPGTNSTLNVGVLFALNDPYLRKKRVENCNHLQVLENGQDHISIMIKFILIS